MIASDLYYSIELNLSISINHSYINYYNYTITLRFCIFFKMRDHLIITSTRLAGG